MTEQQPESQGHPAWQEILDQLPDDLHPLITPKLKEWDEGVQQKLQDVRSQYEGYDNYEPIVKNNIPLERIEGALYLAQMFEDNPEDIVKKAIEEFGLDFIPKSAVPSNNAEEYEEDEELSSLDLENHPAFKAMMEKVEQANSILTSQQQKDQEAEQAKELEEYLSTLHETHGNFDDLYVNALMANGVEAEAAIQLYKDTIATGIQQAMEAQNPGTKVTPPVVLGGDGHSGSGVPAEPVQMGSLNKGSLNDIVMQFLENNDTNKS